MPESTTVLDVPTIFVTVLARPVQPHNATTKTEEFSLNARVVGHQNRCPVENLADVFDVLDKVAKAGLSPVFRKPPMPRVMVADHGPVKSTPPGDDVREILAVVLES